MNAVSEPILTVRDISKTYAGGFQALKNIDLEIDKGEIIALLGPNGAGKTTLISIICGIAQATRGSVSVAGFDIRKDYRKTRSFSRGLFGKSANSAHIEKILRDLSLWDKKDDKIMTLSGGMKRRLLIAKALSHEPTVLFLDEPTAGVDVSLRKDMWKIVEELKAAGVTIILTTHYIEEAEEIADRVGIINNGELILIEEKTKLMSKLGNKRVTLDLCDPLSNVPATLEDHTLELSEDGNQLTYTFTTGGDRTGVTAFLDDLKAADIHFKDLNTIESSLEDIFVNLVQESS